MPTHVTTLHTIIFSLPMTNKKMTHGKNVQNIYRNKLYIKSYIIFL